MLSTPRWLVLLGLVGCRGAAEHVVDSAAPPIDALCFTSGTLTGTIAGHPFGPLSDVRYTPQVPGGAPPYLFVTDGLLTLTWWVGIGGQGVLSTYATDPLAVEYVPAASSMTAMGDPCVTAALHVTFDDGEVVDGTVGAESQ